MKSVIVHGLLALSGLGLAYDAWTREEQEERPAGEVTIAACAADQLESLALETRTQVITAAPRPSASGERYWITLQHKPPEQAPLAAKTQAQGGPEAAPADAGAAESTAAPSEPGRTRSEDTGTASSFLTNEKFDALVGELTPLRAIRGIGEVAPDKHAQFGLDDPEMRLRLRCAGETTELEVGARTYGSDAYYVRRPGEASTFLLRGDIISGLRSARYRFMQSELHRFDLRDVDQAVVRSDGTERTLLHRNRQVPAQARWVDATEPDRRNELFQTWFQRVGQLRADIYLEPDAQPGSELETGGADPVQLLEIAYSLEGQPKGKLELVRLDAAHGSLYYARTETTRAWVRLLQSLAKQVEEDIPQVVGRAQTN